MPKYGEQLSAFATTTAQKTALRLIAVSNRRCEIVEAIMTGGGSVTPADIGHDANLVYIGTPAIDGVATNITPVPFVKSSAAATGSVASNFTVEPTTYDTVFPVFFGFNQRGGQRFSVPQGEGIKVDSGTAAGTRIGFRVISSAVGTVNASMNHWED